MMSEMMRLPLIRLLVILLLATGALLAQHSYTAADVEDGGRLYRANCLSCHGPDGDALPNADLSRNKFHHTSTPAGTEDELIAIMEKGIPGTAMPPNTSFNDFQAATIVAYIRSFADNPSLHSALTGDPARGKQLFDTKGGCLSCHRVNTSGSRLGPNLTDVGANRRTAEIEQALVDPAAEAAPRTASSA